MEEFIEAEAWRMYDAILDIVAAQALLGESAADVFNNLQKVFKAKAYVPTEAAPVDSSSLDF